MLTDQKKCGAGDNSPSSSSSTSVVRRMLQSNPKIVVLCRDELFENSEVSVLQPEY